MIQSTPVDNMDFVFHAVEIVTVLITLVGFFIRLQVMAKAVGEKLDTYMVAQKETQSGIHKILDDHEDRIRDNEKTLWEWTGADRRKVDRREGDK